MVIAVMKRPSAAQTLFTGYSLLFSRTIADARLIRRISIYSHLW